MTNDERDIQRKLRVLRHAEKIGNVRKACRYFRVGRSSFYRWRDAFQDRDLCPKFPPALHGVLEFKSLALGSHFVHCLSRQKFHGRQVAQS